MHYVLPCIILCLLLCAPAQAQNPVASTSKSAKQVEKQFWDKKETQPKLYREYYVLKSFDKDDVLLSSVEVRHGIYAEWNKTGTQKRMIRSLKDIPEWYFKLVESYEDGVISNRENFFASGQQASTDEFEKGVLTTRESNFEQATPVGNGPKKKLERFDATGAVWSFDEWQEDGKPLRLETSWEGNVSSRVTYSYHPDGSRKLEHCENMTYTWDDANKKYVLASTSVTDVAQTDKGICTTTKDGVKVSEGKFAQISVKDGKKSRMQTRKDGEWKYWDETGKLLRVEKYADGELKETKDYK